MEYHDHIVRDPLYTKQFRSILESTGVEADRLPARSPDLNAFAERFVLSIKSECLDHIGPQAQPVNDNAPIVCRERLGGLLKHYVRVA